MIIRNVNCDLDCFAYKNKSCSVLIELVCKTGRCSFYKSKPQFKADLLKYPFVKLSKQKNKIEIVEK